MESLETFLDNFHPVPKPILREYISAWKEVEFKKNELITIPDQKEKYLYFLFEGIHKSYYLHNEKEHIIAFAYPPSYSGVPDSFFTQAPSRYYLESIGHSKALRISYDTHDLFLKEHRVLETLYRKSTEQLLYGVINRLHEIMAFSIEERFKLFTKRSPHLLQMISQKDLASYLRIDPTNFSKLINSIKI